MANILNLDQAMNSGSTSKRHCVKDVRMIDLPEDQAVKSLLQSFRTAEEALQAAEVSGEIEAAQQELEVVSQQLCDLAQLLKSRTNQVHAVLANESTDLGMIEAPRPGLERLLEARKRLQQLEEEKAHVEAVKAEEERNAAAWVSQVKVAAKTAQREGCRAEEMMNNAMKMAQAKREEEAAERARREAEEKARRDAEEKARREAEEKARREAEEKARREAEEKARREAEEKARREAEEKARREAEENARREAEEKARREAEEKARRDAEEKALRRDAEEKAREAEKKAQCDSEEKARHDFEEQREAEEKARRDAEEQREGEEKARRDSMEKIPTEGNKSPGHADQKGEEMIRGEDPVEKSDLPGEKAQVAGQSLFSEHNKDEQEKNRSDSRAEADSTKIAQQVAGAAKLLVKSEACPKVNGEYHRIESLWQGRSAFVKCQGDKVYLVWSPRQAGHWIFTTDPSGEDILARSLQASLTSTPEELMSRSWTMAPWYTRGSKSLVYIQRA